MITIYPRQILAKRSYIFLPGELVSATLVSKPKHQEGRNGYKLPRSMVHTRFLLQSSFLLAKALDHWSKLLHSLQNISHIRKHGGLVFMWIFNEPTQKTAPVLSMLASFVSPQIRLQKLALESTVFFEDLQKRKAPLFHLSHNGFM